MNRLSAIDSIGPAFSRVGTILFKPFRLGTWIKMGFIGLLGGGLATFSMNMNFHAPIMPPRDSHGDFPSDLLYEIQRAIHSVHLENYLHTHFHIIVAVLALIIAISLIFLYLFCRFRFVLFDSVISSQPTVKRGWRQYASQANRYFGFWLAFRIVTLASMVFIIGVPLWHAYKSGAFSGDGSIASLFHMLASIALSAFAAVAVFAIVSTLMKDFIMPIMALDGLLLGDAWSALWRVIASEPGAWLGYLGMKVVLAIGAGIALAIAGFIAMLPALLIIGIPVSVLVVPGVFALKAGATAGAIILFVIAGALAITGLFCLYMILIAPLTVFFPAYAFYFFGGRYPKLGALLWPEPVPPAPVPQVAGTQQVV
ncbi:MAG TPA: hypothetical protein VFB76_18065 [Candidatus Angelobacter sp.]|nr:hypothetical protein [Candidatus Angelobacter sp.]